MELESAPNLKSIILVPLICASLTGALLGAFFSTGISVFSAIQAVICPDQLTLWGMSAGKIFFVAIFGLTLGSAAGLERGTGSVAARQKVDHRHRTARRDRPCYVP